MSEKFILLSVMGLMMYLRMYTPTVLTEKSVSLNQDDQ